jgi:hypothetical protein
MAVISFTSSAAQDAIVQIEIDRQNADIDKANIAITAQNVVLAAQQPPGTPIALIPRILTIQAWVIADLLARIADIKARQATTSLSAAQARWFASTTAQQAAALAQLAVVP